METKREITDQSDSHCLQNNTSDNIRIDQADIYNKSNIVKGI